MEKVTAFYDNEFKIKCVVATRQEEGNSFKEAVCTQSAGPGLIRAFKISEKPLELQMDVGAMPDPSEKDPKKLLGFRVERRQDKMIMSWRAPQQRRGALLESRLRRQIVFSA